mgnify:CR=1 FL=1
MKAIILAAGKGTRMGALTDETPKPMLRVEGRPILEHILTGLRDAGISEFYLITGWKAEVIEAYFGDGSNWGVSLGYTRQVVQDGTGKAPELAREFVEDNDFLLTYGDILVKPEMYRLMLERWAEDDFAGLVTVTGSEDVTKGGLFFFDEKFFFFIGVTKKHKKYVPTCTPCTYFTLQVDLSSDLLCPAGGYQIGPTYPCRFSDQTYLLSLKVRQLLVCCYAQEFP